MDQSGKESLKRSKPNYLYSIIGVSLVLVIMGIMGWLFLNFRQISKAFKEDIRISIYLRTLNKDSIEVIRNYINAQPYSKNVTYVDKKRAKEIWNSENNEDWAKILTVNPLPESIDFYAKADYVNQDSILAICNQILKQFPNEVTDVKYPPSLVTSLDQKSNKIGLIFLVVSISLCIVVIFSIDNTIRLAMFSNRFLIKTMQMVGATRGFISRPMEIRPVINGFISSGIAIFVLFSLMEWAENQFPQLSAIQTTENTVFLFGGMILVGVGISTISTRRSILKYLKMKLDDLY